MCQATIVLEDGNGEKEIIKDVIHLKVEGDTVWCARHFEQPTPVEGTIKEIDFLKHRVLLTLNMEGER